MALSGWQANTNMLISSALAPPGDVPWSYSVWYKPSGFLSYRCPISLLNGNGPNILSIRVDGSGVAIGLTLDAGGNTQITGGTLNLNAWNHIALAGNGSSSTLSTCDVWVNGVIQAGSNTTTRQVRQSVGNTFIHVGGESNNDFSCAGKIDFAALWIGYRLLQADVTNLQTLYPNASALTAPTSYWILNANTNISDQMPAGNTLNLTGTLTVDNADIPSLSAGSTGKKYFFINSMASD